ncbi:MAG: septal junction protein FraD [Aulosira sp. ZfuVER01]|nr:septal junction protein FraD [Aulosira sp. ZfuVER01]MDZ7997521.1 septal junction protein FraD [Aulosira sp. DedVER01a]MDZ8055614.1 septal junction protein FraD [Aulosira sp. ZfuCHP01]
MNTLFKDLLGLTSFLADIYAGIKKLLIPQKAYSWQTFIYLSLFSWAISSFATGAVKDTIAFFGWLFLIAGTSWYTTDDPARVPGTYMPVGAVITGFLVSVFAFGQQEETGVSSGTIVLWPTISALITAIPEFFEGTGTEAKAQLPKPEDRQKIIVLVASCMLLSCWIQFYFVVNIWLQEYPSLLSDNFKRSTFVVRTEFPTKTSLNGTLILKELQPKIEKQIDKQPWPQVERWLQNANANLDNLTQEVIQEKRLKEKEVKDLWRIEPRITNPNPKNKDEYILDIVGIWTGPSSDPRGYYLNKSCQIRPIAESPNKSTAQKPENTRIIAEVECEPRIKRINGRPPAQR